MVFPQWGVGLPMAIAIKLIDPQRCVVAICGDMVLWMSLGELGIVQERNLDLIVVYLCDNKLSLIDIKQQRDEIHISVSPLTILMYSILHQHLVVLVIVVPMHKN